ncbi:outer membrane autotransporter barrel domain protein [Archangium gephyra]|uniref:Outer membrane autotransporter barrel domain protein n=1 Tax=Archangium gephyra TaxID=48 RepID=A0AAC8Q865_9BACT|nr:outer membrane autotransporter barrel domain protein [Archangium gephyra]
MLLTACPDPAPKPEPNPGGDPAPPTTLTVTGRVLDGEGQPLENASILIPGDDRHAVDLDRAGAFSIDGVTAPYDVIVVQRTLRTAAVYKGLSRQDLTLPFATREEDDDRSAGLQGTVTGGSTPYDSIRYTRVEFASASSSSATNPNPGGTYYAAVGWRGPASITGTLYVLQSERSRFFSPPSRYLGFGRRDNVTLNDTAMHSAVDITLTPVAEARLAGSITVPDGYALTTLDTHLVPDGSANTYLFSDTEPGSAFDYLVPQIPQSTFTMNVNALMEKPGEPLQTAYSKLYKKGLTAGTRDAALVIQAAPQQGQPANEATEVTRATEFSWTGFTGGIHQFQIQEDDPAEGTFPYTVNIYTSGTRTTLPDLSAVDMSLPASTTFSWNVQGFAPVASMDALSLLSEQGNPFLGSTDVSVGISGSRSFTTSATP